MINHVPFFPVALQSPQYEQNGFVRTEFEPILDVLCPDVIFFIGDMSTDSVLRRQIINFANYCGSIQKLFFHSVNAPEQSSSLNVKGFVSFNTTSTNFYQSNIGFRRFYTNNIKQSLTSLIVTDNYSNDESIIYSIRKVMKDCVVASRSSCSNNIQWMPELSFLPRSVIVLSLPSFFYERAGKSIAMYSSANIPIIYNEDDTLLRLLIGKNGVPIMRGDITNLQRFASCDFKEDFVPRDLYKLFDLRQYCNKVLQKIGELV